MPSLSDRIEEYLCSRIAQTTDGVLEIQRGEISARFGCAPSQINYVLETRFGPARGYLIESRRGGGGYIRIVRVPLDRRASLLAQVERYVGEWISQEQAEQLIRRCREEGLIEPREAAVLLAACDRRTLAVELPQRDALRARLLRSMLLALERATPSRRLSG